MTRIIFVLIISLMAIKGTRVFLDNDSTTRKLTFGTGDTFTNPLSASFAGSMQGGQADYFLKKDAGDNSFEIGSLVGTNTYKRYYMDTGSDVSGYGTITYAGDTSGTPIGHPCGNSGFLNDASCSSLPNPTGGLSLDLSTKNFLAFEMRALDVANFQLTIRFWDASGNTVYFSEAPAPITGTSYITRIIDFRSYPTIDWSNIHAISIEFRATMPSDFQMSLITAMGYNVEKRLDGPSTVVDGDMLVSMLLPIPRSILPIP